MSKKALSLALALAAMVLLVGCGGGGEEAAPARSAEEPSAAPAATATGGNGVISGTIAYANGDPDMELIMDADPICLDAHKDEVAMSESVVADGGGLANVFVYVKSGLTGSYPPPSENALLDQKGCMYSPHVSGLQVGQKLVIRNSDPTLHNVHALPKKNQEFNQGQPFEGMELEKTFDQAEVMIPFKCDVHPWMASYIGVLDHPYFAVTGADGSFSIDGLPAGDFEVEAWHEKLGAKTMSISVAADGTAEANFDFSPTA